jgi:hypothetical protein
LKKCNFANHARPGVEQKMKGYQVYPLGWERKVCGYFRSYIFEHVQAVIGIFSIKATML